MNAYFLETPKDRWLELTPLSKITDEEAIEVARICSKYLPTGNLGGFRIEVYKSIHNRTVVSWGSSHKDKFLVESAVNITSGADFLRSRGYAIPFEGKSVDELIEMGVLKLRE